MTATIHTLNAKREPSLDALFALVATDLNAVNQVILARMQSDIPLIPELAGHLIAGGGKRMRPMLTLAVWLYKRVKVDTSAVDPALLKRFRALTFTD